MLPGAQKTHATPSKPIMALILIFKLFYDFSIFSLLGLIGEKTLVNSFIHLSNNRLYMPENTDMQNRGLIGLMADIKNGIIRIPDFQRGYIWTRDQITELLDSVWNGYPLGSILLWKTREDLKERDPLNLRLPKPPDKSERNYLLDGQQRLITLYSVVHGKVLLTRKLKAQAFFHLDKKNFVLKSDEELVETPLTLEQGFLPLTKMFCFADDAYSSAGQDREIMRALTGNPDRSMAYTDLYGQFSSLKFPTVTNGQPLAVACKIFERLNNTGTRLTVADLMVAITYRHNFNLRDKLVEVNDDFESKYYALSERTILQCISACLEKGTEKDNIIDSSNKIHEEWEKSIESTQLAADFLRAHCYVPVSKFLPYEIILAPLSYFFYKYGSKPLDPARAQRLKKYFWLNMLSERYTSSQSSRAEEDIKNMDLLLSNPDIDLFNYYEKPVTKETIKALDMSFNSGLAVTVLCFLASKNPREFQNDLIVRLDQTFGEANQSQLHHIFPVNYLKIKFEKDEKYFKTYIKPYINSIANISLISRACNRDIWDKEPSVYFGQFEKRNSMLRRDLETHLITDVDNFGLKSNDFPKFIDARADRIANEINGFATSLKEN